MRWPSPQDFRESIQSPLINLSDPELRESELALDALQLPIVTCGQFAAVFKITGTRKTWAVRCFLHNFPDRHERYKRISEFILKDDLEYTVDFELIDKGIQVGDEWYPLLKMEYVTGIPLGRYVRENLKSTEKLSTLLQQFEEMMFALKNDGIAHGDLQHDNILINEQGRLRLIDYDGMFVPSLKGWRSNELGHRNFQHPGRTETCFGPSLDNFAAHLIRDSLKCLIEDENSHKLFLKRDEAFFLSREDYLNEDSDNFGDMETAGGSCLEFSRRIRTLLRKPIEEIPFIDESFVNDLEMVPALATKSRESNSSKIQLNQGSRLNKLSDAELMNLDKTDRYMEGCALRPLCKVEAGMDLGAYAGTALKSVPGKQLIWMSEPRETTEWREFEPRSRGLQVLGIVVCLVLSILSISALPVAAVFMTCLVLIFFRMSLTDKAIFSCVRFGVSKGNLLLVFRTNCRYVKTETPLATELVLLEIPLSYITIAWFSESGAGFYVSTPNEKPFQKNFDGTFGLQNFDSEECKKFEAALREAGMTATNPYLETWDIPY